MSGPDGGGRRITRRRLIAGGGALVGLAVAGSYGRFALGDDFEQHVANVIGAPPEVTTPLLEGMRTRLGSLDYETRATAFLAATTFPGRSIIPAGTRARAIDPFVENLIGGSAGNITYLGLRPPLSAFECAGLVVEQ